MGYHGGPTKNHPLNPTSIYEAVPVLKGGATLCTTFQRDSDPRLGAYIIEAGAVAGAHTRP